jgi:gliding motility-associated-like protein
MPRLSKNFTNKVSSVLPILSLMNDQWKNIRSTVSWLFVFIFTLSPTVKAQNLAPNPSFEVFVSCDLNMSGGGPLACPPWYSPNTTANFFQSECPPCLFGVPCNAWGQQFAHTGFAYTGGYLRTDNFNYREWIRAPLLDTMEAGVCYKIGFWTNKSDNSCGIQNVGMLLSAGPVEFPLNQTPQLDWSGEFMSDSANWTFVFDYYTAIGNEAWVTIGNFHNDSQTPFDPACDNVPPFAYYYWDDVVIEPVPGADFEVSLDAEGSACDSFLLQPLMTPDYEEALYTWSNGQHGKNIYIFESGIYTLTVTYGCFEAIASITLTIENPPPVELGDDVTICIGESYTVELDPDLGTYEWNDGSSETEYTIDQPGIYSVTLDDGCDLLSDTIEIVHLAPPIVLNLGPDTILCEGDEYLIQLDPSLGDFHWQNNSDEASYEINHEGTYALTITNMCGETSDEIVAEYVDPPYVELGPDSTVICEGSPYFIDLDPNVGTYVWQDGIISYSYFIQNTGLYSVTVSNECGSETDMLYVEEVIPPSIDFGLPIEACQGDTISLSAGQNTGNYIWQNGSTDSTFTVTSSGTFALTISNDCGSDVASIPIHFNPLITQPDLGPDIVLCPGQQVILKVTTAGANYLWNDLSVADSIIVSTPGTYFVRVYNYCNIYTDTINVTINNAPPDVSLPPDISLCQGQSTILDAALSNVSYLWSDGSQAHSLLVSAPGLYSVTVSNACGTDMDSIVIGDGGDIPLVELGIDTSLCAGSSFNIVPTAFGVSNWLWQDGSMGSSVQVNGPGEIHVVVSNICGVAYDTMYINLLPAIPVLDLGPDVVMCPGEMVTLSISIPSVDILWQDGSSNPDYVVTDSTLLIATIFNSCGVAQDSVEISLLDEVPPVDLGPDQTICPGVMFTIDPQIDNVDYLWQDGSTADQFTVLQGGEVILILSNVCGSSTDTLKIIESNEGPQVDLGPDRQACAGESITVYSNIHGVDFLWQDGSADDSLTISTSGTFILEVSNLCGLDRDTIVVDISGELPVPELGPDTSICENVQIILHSNADPITSQQWQDGSMGSNYLVTTPGIYSIHQTNRCGEGRDSVEISFIDAPDPFDLGPDTILCPDQSIVILAPPTLFDILWQDGSHENQMLANQDIVYSLQLSNECGLQKDSLEVKFNLEVPDVDLGPEIPWCIGDTIQLDASQNIMVTYQWNTGATTPTIQVTLPGPYDVKVLSACAEAEGNVIVIPVEDCGPDFYIPNVFSPGADGINDIFSLSFGDNITIIGSVGTIFDRWGNQVFYSTQIPFQWNGKFHDEKMQPAVFAYVLNVQYRFRGNEYEKTFYGDVTLLR